MFHSIRGFTVIAILFLFISGNLFAQSIRSLTFDSWISGELREGEEQWFSVWSAENGVVVVESSGETDTYLEAYDASYNLIDEDDDGGEGLNARLGITVEAGRTYLFKLRCFDEDESGPYQIRAAYGSLRELPFGTWVSGTLRAEEEQWFSIRPLGTGHVVVETTGNTDTFLKAYGPAGPAIAEDDDGGEGYNARLEFFAEAGKTYRIKLSHFEGTRAPYQVRAGFEPLPPDVERNIERSRAVPIKLGEPVQVYLRSSSESRWYRYDIQRAGTLFVVQTRGNLDTILSLYDAQGNFIKEDDDSGEGANALISERVGPGTVYIEVKEFEGHTGRCTLHAEFR